MLVSTQVANLKCLYVDYMYEIAAAAKYGLQADDEAANNAALVRYYIFYEESGCDRTTAEDCTVENFYKNYFLRIFECSDQTSCVDGLICSLTVTVVPPPAAQCLRPPRF